MSFDVTFDATSRALRATHDFPAKTFPKERIKKEKKKHLFTLGSIFSTKANGAEQTQKQIIQINLTDKNGKNPNCSEANQLAIYKDDRGIEPGTTQNNTS